MLTGCAAALSWLIMTPLHISLTPYTLRVLAQAIKLQYEAFTTAFKDRHYAAPWFLLNGPQLTP